MTQANKDKKLYCTPNHALWSMTREELHVPSREWNSHEAFGQIYEFIFHHEMNVSQIN